MSISEEQTHESKQIENSDSEQTPTNRVFRIGCMTFCIAVTLLFLWVWHHQSQFNDNYRQASFHINNGEPEQAIAAYQKAIKNKERTIFFKNAPTAYNNLGDAYLKAGQYEQAISTFKDVIKIAPNMAEGYVNLATVYLQKGEPSNAREICLHALQKFPDAALLHFNLACAYSLSDEPTEAKASLKSALSIDADLINDLLQQEESLQHILPELQ
ncbi:MAG: tetratricopeptide repeat protein [Candidatus Poribacteria bacterium]|nr:tetratricopeptide repeat protein [Candidatus Poribacteria bacterium]